METIFAETVDLELVADLCAIGIKRKPLTPRNYEKWHVSNLIDSAKLISRGDVRYSGDNEVPPSIRALGHIGRIWESAIDCYLAYYAVQKGGVYVPDMEQEKDGILGSLDGIMILPELGVLVCETKLKFSLHGEIPLRDLQQTRAYCYLADTDLVCYVSGHLSSAPPTARAEMRVFRFTQQSIKETWEMLVNTRDYLIKCGAFCGVSVK